MSESLAVGPSIETFVDVTEDQVKGKKVMLVPELLYERNMHCPHCQSKKKPIYLSDLKNLPDNIIDALKCAECEGVYLVLSHPRIYFPKPIVLNWDYKDKGEAKDEQ